LISKTNPVETREENKDPITNNQENTGKQSSNENEQWATTEEGGFEDLPDNVTESVERFEDLVLKEDVMRGIFGYGFVKPSPIQQKGILPLIQGKDTIAQVNFILNNKRGL
jgi:translation initiation factor 4A